MTKRPLGHGNIRNMGDFKAVQMDYAYYLTLEDVGRLYCLTDRQVYVLMVQLTYVGWLTRWYNVDDITQTTVGYIQSELMERLMSCVDISILVDQAKLNLSTQTQNQDVQAQILRDALEDRYDGDPTSINPSAPTTNFGSTGDRFDALCSGLMAFVYGFARVQADHVRIAQVGGLAAAALVAALLIPGLNFFFIVGASIAVILGMGTIGVSTEVAIAALTDTTALDAVVCYMRDTLKSESVTEANWSACLNSYPFGVGTHEAIICDFIKPTLAQNYLTILNILGQAYDGTINGDAMPECPCEEPPVDWIKDIFTSGDQHSWEAVGAFAAFDNGWTDGSADDIQIGIKKLFSGQTLTAMRVVFDVPFPGTITAQSLGNYDATDFEQMTPDPTYTYWELLTLDRDAGIFLNFVRDGTGGITGHKIVEIWYKVAP